MIREIEMRISIPLLLSAGLATTAACSAQAVSAIAGNAGQRLQGDGIAVEIRAAHGRFQGLRVIPISWRRTRSTSRRLSR
jgi:mevalonate kinase